jgi:hypothetical protein
VSTAARALAPTRSTPFTLNLSLLTPSLSAVIFLFCLAFYVAGAPQILSADGDAARHRLTGEYILTTGWVPTADVFSHTMAGQPFVAKEWLADVASALAYRGLGWGGVLLLHASVVGGAFAVLFWHARVRRAPALPALVVVGTAVAASTVHWLARPHVFTFLGLALLLAFLDRWHAGAVPSRWLWALPVGIALWANLHGGFVVGIAAIGAYVAADAARWLTADSQRAHTAGARLRAIAPPALLCLLAPVVHPTGLAALTHVSSFLASSRFVLDTTAEYKSPNFHEPHLRPFLGLLLVTAGAAACSRRGLRLHEGLLLAGFGYLALFSTRNVPLFAVVAAPIAVELLRELPPLGGRLARVSDLARRFFAKRSLVLERVDARSSSLSWPALALAGLVLVASSQQRAGQAPLGAAFDPTMQPVAAVEYLKTHPPTGPMFNEMAWGGYLLDQLWPAQPVFFDGWTDFYGEPLTREYVGVVQLEPGWRDTLDKYGVRWVITKSGSGLTAMLAASPDWRTVYQDDVAAVLVRP